VVCGFSPKRGPCKIHGCKRIFLFSWYEERSQRHAEKRTPLKDPEPAHAPKVDSRYQDRSQRHTEKRTSLTGPKQAHVRGNSRKRVFNNRARKPHTEKQPPRYVSKELGTDTSTNNNSGDIN